MLNVNKMLYTTFHLIAIISIFVLLIEFTVSLSTPNNRVGSLTGKRIVTLSDQLAPNSIKRRSFLVTTAAGVIGVSIRPSPVRGDNTIVKSSINPKKSICVIGANGKTGSECVGFCNKNKLDVIATSRSGMYTGVYTPTIQSVCDVTVPSTIQSVVRGCRVVIFAASASKSGGTPSAVDNAGLVNVAKICIDEQVPHLVIISSGGVSKPDSPVYKFLNIFGRIMEEKIKGENTVRALYASSATSGSDTRSSCTYTIVRPGGLTEEMEKGVGSLELNQGDTKSGRISRADVASLCIEATNFPQMTGGTTFECYDANTAKTLGSVGVSNILKKTNTDQDSVLMSGKERRGTTFSNIFTGLERDSTNV